MAIENYKKQHLIIEKAYEYIENQLDSINAKNDLMNNPDEYTEGHYGLNELNMQLSWVLKHVELLNINDLDLIEEFDLFFEDSEIYRLLNKYKIQVSWDCKYYYNKDNNEIVEININDNEI
jgi:hypothetical protein